MAVRVMAVRAAERRLVVAQEGLEFGAGGDRADLCDEVGQAVRTEAQLLEHGADGAAAGGGGGVDAVEGEEGLVETSEGAALVRELKSDCFHQGFGHTVPSLCRRFQLPSIRLGRGTLAANYPY